MRRRRDRSVMIDHSIATVVGAADAVVIDPAIASLGGNAVVIWRAL